MSEVTRILVTIEQGDVRAVDKLFPLVYQELRRLAAQRLNRELRGNNRKRIDCHVGLWPFRKDGGQETIIKRQ